MSESNRPLDDDGFLLAREPEEEARPDDRIDDERMDEENTLKPEFVRSVEDALDEGDVKAVYELVEPLHPADIADLLELFERDERYQLAAAITDLMTSEVVAELNDYVRETMMEALPPEAVAQIVDQLETDDAVQLIEDLDDIRVWQKDSPGTSLVTFRGQGLVKADIFSVFSVLYGQKGQ